MLIIIIDVRVRKNEDRAFFIFNKQSNEYIDMIRMNYRRKLIIVL
jgi:hypothetical protein